MSDSKLFSSGQGFEFFNKNLLAVPPEATYHRSPHSDAHILRKETKKIFPENTQTLGPNGVIRFHIHGAGKMLDLKSLLMHMSVKVTVGADANVQMNEYMGSLIRTLTVRLNNSFLVDRVDYQNILHNAISSYQVPRHHRKSLLGIVQGYLDNMSNLDVKLDQQEKKQYTIRFDTSGFLSQNVYLPMDAVRSLDIELTLESHNILFGTAAALANASFEVDDVYLTADQYEFSIPYRSSLLAAMESSGLFLEYSSYVDYSPQIIAENSNQTIRVRKSFSSLKSAYLVMTLPNTVHPLSAFYKNHLQRYQIFVDGLPVTSHQITCSDGNCSESVLELFKSFNLHGDIRHAPDVIMDQYVKNEPFVGDVQDDPLLLDNTSVGTKLVNSELARFMIGVDLDKSSLQSGTSCEEIAFQLEFTGGAQGVKGTTAHIYFLHDRQLRITPGFQFLGLN